jgi:uncharacterized protein DUF1552
MIITKKHLPRRTFLRGIAGATVALPLLDSMIPALTAQSKTAAKPQFRAAFIYTPHGVILDKWVPKTGGVDYEMTPILKPLEAFRDRLLIYSNLAENKGKQAGSGHASSSATWLSGAICKETSGEDVHAGTTIDQMIASKIGQDTPIPSVELGIEDVSNMVGACDGTSSCAYLNTMSWRTPTTPLPAEINPRIVFERMFGDGSSAAERFSRLQEDRSLLDSITSAARKLQTKVSAQDRTRISDYLDNLREIERRIGQVEKRNTDQQLSVPQAPVDIPELYEDHVGLMFDLQVVAFQADITRVITFMMSRELNSRTYPQIGVPDQHHSVSHHQYNPAQMEKHQKINTYHVQLYSRFLEKMKNTPDGQGSLLDHSMLLFGSGMGDGNVHSHDPLSVVLTGGAVGQIKTGRHITNPKGTPLANLLLSMLEMAGTPAESIGDSTGKLPV